MSPQGLSAYSSTDTPTLGFSGFLLPSTAAVHYSQLVTRTMNGADSSGYPTPGNYSKEIKAIHETLDIDHMKQFLTKFTRSVSSPLNCDAVLIVSFRTRYYRSETGKQSQQFLLATVKKAIGSRQDVTVEEFEHPWGQNSIIVHFKPSEKKAQKAPVTIIGAHQDSTNQWPFLPAP